MCDILTDPCKNGGFCQPHGSSFKCCCDFGWTGESCLVAVIIFSLLAIEQYHYAHHHQDPYDREQPLSVAFSGDGYAQFDAQMLPHAQVDEHEVIRLSFTTTASEGLLFYHGVRPGQEPFGQDYLVVAIVDGFLEFAWELGSGPAQVRSALPVNDGRAHRVVLLRKGN